MTLTMGSDYDVAAGCTRRGRGVADELDAPPTRTLPVRAPYQLDCASRPPSST